MRFFHDLNLPPNLIQTDGAFRPAGQYIVEIAVKTGGESGESVGVAFRTGKVLGLFLPVQFLLTVLPLIAPWTPESVARRFFRIEVFPAESVRSAGQSAVKPLNIVLISLRIYLE